MRWGSESGGSTLQWIQLLYVWLRGRITQKNFGRAQRANAQFSGVHVQRFYGVRTVYGVLCVGTLRISEKNLCTGDFHLKILVNNLSGSM